MAEPCLQYVVKATSIGSRDRSPTSDGNSYSRRGSMKHNVQDGIGRSGTGLVGSVPSGNFLARLPQIIFCLHPHPHLSTGREYGFKRYRKRG